MKEETILKNEWINHFGLTAISTWKYYKIVGCFLIGFEQIRTRGELQPHFMIYPLWGNDIKECLQGYCLYHCIEDSKGFPYQISVSKMLAHKDEVFLNAEKYMGFDLTNEIHKNQILDIFNRYSKEWDSNPVRQKAIIVLKIHMATYLNDKKLFDDTMSSSSMETMEKYARTKPQWFEEMFGKYDSWKENLISVFSNRQAIMDKINANITSGKIKQRLNLLSEDADGVKYEKEKNVDGHLKESFSTHPEIMTDHRNLEFMKKEDYIKYHKEHGK